MADVRVIGDRVVLEPIENESKTGGGIIIMGDSIKDNHKGRVISVGAGVRDVKAGDIVIYCCYAGTNVEVGDKEYLIVTQGDILATVQEVGE